MTFPIKTAALAIPLVLAACSSDGSNEQALRTLGEFATSPFRATPEIKIESGKTYIIAAYTGARTPMIFQNQKNGIAQYEGPGGVQMTLNNGFLARLRGLGQENEAFYVDSESPYREDLLKAAREKRTTFRVVEYWIDQRPRRDRFRCTLAFEKIEKGFRRLSETCHSIYGPLNFTNHFWTDRNANIARSQQWFHPKAFPLEIDHIPRIQGSGGN